MSWVYDMTNLSVPRISSWTASELLRLQNHKSISDQCTSPTSFLNESRTACLYETCALCHSDRCNWHLHWKKEWETLKLLSYCFPEYANHKGTMASEQKKNFLWSIQSGLSRHSQAVSSQHKCCLQGCRTWTPTGSLASTLSPLQSRLEGKKL